MAFILPIEEPWTSQPQVPVTLSPRYADALLAYVPSVSFRTELNGSALSIEGLPYISRTPGVGGIGMTMNQSPGYLTKALTVSDNTLSTATLIVIQSLALIANNYGWHCFQSDALNNSHFCYGGNVYLSTFSSSRWLNGVAVKPGYQKPHALIVRANGTERTAWQGGQLLGSATSDTKVRWVGWYIGTNMSYYPGVSTYGLILLPRAITDTEVAEISLNPWNIFAP